MMGMGILNTSLCHCNNVIQITDAPKTLVYKPAVISCRPNDIFIGGAEVVFLLLLPRFPKLPSQCYSNGPGNVSSLARNEEIQPQCEWNYSKY